MLQRVLWLVAGLAAVLSVAVWFDHSVDPINPTALNRVKPGMTLEEVEAAIGVEAGPYRWYDELSWQDEVTWLRRPDHQVRRLAWLNWRGNTYSLSVGFDDKGAAAVSFYKLEEPSPSIPDRVIHWLAGWK